MEQIEESPLEGKTEQQSGSLLYTYFQGDINSMVDAHFSRALSQVTKPKGDGNNSKKIRKSAKTKQASSSDWDMRSPPIFESSYRPDRIQLGSHKGTQMSPVLPPVPPAESSTIWPGGPQEGPSLVLPSIVYPSATTAEGLVVPDHQYSNSLLNLLHTDRPDLGTVMVSSSKQEFMPGWMRHPEFGDQMRSHQNLDSGVQVVEKNDLYWY